MDAHHTGGFGKIQRLPVSIAGKLFYPGTICLEDQI
jgi:hypothetical protein